jgi:amidophosphoribosyltransferase
MREKVLIFGANFPIATRIADLVRRDFEVILYEFSASSESVQKQVSTEFTGEILSSALALHEARYVVFTSESLLYILSPSAFSGLLDEFRACKRLAGTYLAFVDIAEPIVAEAGRSIKVLQGDSDYGVRLALLREALVAVVDCVIQVQSVYTPEEDLWGQNFLRLLFDAKEVKPIEVRKSAGNWEAFSADEVARELVSRLGSAGTTRLSLGPYCGGLQAFCATATHEYTSWVASQTSVQSNKTPNLLASSVHRLEAPIHTGLHVVARQSHCSVNYLYRKAPEESFGTRNIAHFRKELGRALARSIPIEVVGSVDMIVPVPETGKIYAQGLAQSLCLPYVEAIYKADRKRSFDIESFDERREFLYSRLSVVPGLLEGKSVIVVDEAIFTGATLKVVSRLLWDEGALCVYFEIPSPEARYSCKFNMQPRRGLLSQYVRKEDLRSYFDVQGVFFQDEEVFIQSIDQDGPQCVACFIQRNSNDHFS